MKCTVILDAEHQEEVLIYARERTALVQQIERLTAEDGIQLIGYRDKIAVPLDLSAVYRFTVENDKVYADTDKERLRIKQRLYRLETHLPDCFIKINQSCIANIRHIARFDGTFGGALAVIFRNGERDYISRRQLKSIKERLKL